MERLDPKNDLVFKLLLTREPALLIHMLEGFLGRRIVSLEILNPDIPGELSSDKTIVLDIRAVLADGSRVDLEMQMYGGAALVPRRLYYAARDYADQLRRGGEYQQLTPTIGIVWLVKPLFPSIDRLHSVFELRERHHHTLFSDHLAFHVVQLSNLRSARVKGYDARVGRWARFLLAKTDADFDQLATEDPIMRLAKESLDRLSSDPRARRLAREREDSMKLYAMSLRASEARGRAEGEARGRAEGEARGRAAALLGLLRLRFGTIPERTRARIERAPSNQLDTWLERVLTAQTLEQAVTP